MLFVSMKQKVINFQKETKGTRRSLLIPYYILLLGTHIHCFSMGSKGHKCHLWWHRCFASGKTRRVPFVPFEKNPVIKPCRVDFFKGGLFP
jgi:hypothetical protein